MSVKREEQTELDWAKLFKQHYEAKGSWNDFIKESTAKDDNGAHNNRPSAVMAKWHMGPASFYLWRKRAEQVVTNGSQSKDTQALQSS